MLSQMRSGSTFNSVANEACVSVMFCEVETARGVRQMTTILS